MFKWQPTYDTLDEIPEGARDAYEEKDGKFQIIRALSKTALENAYKSTKDKLAKAEAVLKNIPEDFDAEKLSQMVDELEDLRGLKEAGALDGKNKDQIEELVAKRVETEKKKFERETAKIAKERDDLMSALDGTKTKLKTVSLETQARALAAKFKIAEHSIDDALFHVNRAFDLDEEGNVVDRSDAGRTLEDWFSETVPNKPGWTFAPSAAGSGASGGSPGKAGVKTMKRADFDRVAKENPKQAAAFMATVRAGEAQLVE